MGPIVIIAIIVVVALAGLLVATTAGRRDRAAALGGLREANKRDKGSQALARIAEEAGVPASGREVERQVALARQGKGTDVVVVDPPPPPALRQPIDPETYAVTRRQFFNRGITTLFTLSLSGFGAACIAFLWPSVSGGFGSKIKVGKLDDILAQIASTREPFYVAEARTWVSAYPKENAQKAGEFYTGAVLTGMENGVVALYQKCVHLGCRVPWCKASQWFECPCHGSKYNRVGEKTGGPAPRGLDRFGVDVSGGILAIDTAQIIQGPKIGVNSTGQQAEGPHCA
jgi:cytochrome b6-f complex iron-sulfur subunit